VIELIDLYIKKTVFGTDSHYFNRLRKNECMERKPRVRPEDWKKDTEYGYKLKTRP